MTTFARLIWIALSRSKNYLQYVTFLFAAVLYLINRSLPVRRDNQHNVQMMQQKMRIKNAERLAQSEGKSELYPWSDGTMRRQDPTYGLIDRDIQLRVNKMDPKDIAQRVAMETTLQDRRNRYGY